MTHDNGGPSRGAVAAWVWRADPWLTAVAGAAVVALLLRGARSLLSARRLRRPDRG